MKRLWCYFVLLSSALLSLSLSSCRTINASGSSTTPVVLRYAFAPEEEQLQGGSIRADLMKAYLQKELHRPVEVIRVEGYASTIEAMRADKVDISTYGALGYIIAAQKGGAEAIVARGNPDGSLGGYRSMIAVPKNSPIHSMQDLKARAKDIVFSFSDPASTSGNLYPRVGLLSMGINPEKDFKKVVFSGTHPATVLTVAAGKVDAGAFSASVLPRLIALHKIAPNDLRILWTSELIPNGPTAVRKGLPDQLKKDIQAALLAIPTKDPELWSNIVNTYRTNTSGMSYVSVNDGTYNGLRSYTSKVKDFNFVDK
jgi:phosphonate transport system substrate-binding protein